jgi:hypothetical protein
VRRGRKPSLADRVAERRARRERRLKR